LTRRGVFIGLLILAAGFFGGWTARGCSAGSERAHSQPEERDDSDEARPSTAAAGPRSHDDELRQILLDPKAHVLGAKVRNASAVEGQCEVEVDTTIGWFRVGCGMGETPSVGDRFDLFGRVSPDGQIDGVPTLLRPAWLEPVGTIARLRGP
jgi:hypothetical protein